MEIIEPDLEKAVKAVKAGKVLVCPTDTVYGLVCGFNNKLAVERIYKIKKRPKSKLLPIFVKDIKMAKTLAEISQSQEKFLKKVWPGKITVVLKAKEKGTIGLRIPEYELVRRLAARTGPLAETSANISGKPATAKIKEVLKYFKGREYQPDLVLDAGDLKPARPSKVIDLTGPKSVILRK